MSTSIAKLLESVSSSSLKKDLPNFRPGDTVRVHAKIVEGTRERIQIFEGVVLKREKGNLAHASFTVRKVSYNIGVERTFLLHSPRVEKIEVVSRGDVRRARLFYLRPLRGKATRIKSRYGVEVETVVTGNPVTGTAVTETAVETSPEVSA